jgi:hypothetical protein
MPFVLSGFILPKQKGRLRAARLFGWAGDWREESFCCRLSEALRLRADDLVFLAFNRPGSDLLSRVLRRSTIGAGAFHGRVRNGNGCSHPAITTRSTKGKNCAGDSAKPNEKLVEVFTSFVLNTFFTMIFALGFDRSRKASQAQSASPVVWRAVRSAAALRRQREDKTRLLMLIFDEQ